MRGALALMIAAAMACARALPSGAPAPAPAVHFHHVHLNVTDPAATIAFYQKFFGAIATRYRGLSDALFTERSFILLSQVASAPPTSLATSLWHIGWAGVDGPSEFAWRAKAGIGVHTPLTPLGANHYMYFWGPDREVIEVYTGSRNHRFEHFHLLAGNLAATLRWFGDHLGLQSRMPAASTLGGVAINLLRVDNVNVYVFERPAAGQPRPDWFPPEVGDTFLPSEGTAIDHVAFSASDITPLFERLRRSGVTIVRPPASSAEYGMTSFFVRGPDGLLIEIVEEAPIPEGIWRPTPR